MVASNFFWFGFSGRDSSSLLTLQVHPICTFLRGPDRHGRLLQAQAGDSLNRDLTEYLFLCVLDHSDISAETENWFTYPPPHPISSVVLLTSHVVKFSTNDLPSQLCQPGVGGGCGTQQGYVTAPIPGTRISVGVGRQKGSVGGEGHFTSLKISAFYNSNWFFKFISWLYYKSNKAHKN